MGKMSLMKSSRKPLSTSIHDLPHQGIFYILDDDFVLISKKEVDPTLLKKVSSKLVFKKEIFTISSNNDLITHLKHESAQK